MIKWGFYILKKLVTVIFNLKKSNQIKIHTISNFKVLY